MAVGNYMKQLRKENNESQLNWSLKFDVSREAISSYETGRTKLPGDIAQKITEKYNDPFLGMEAAAEYTGWGPTKLNGPAVDLHRTTVSIKTKEELQEALQSMSEAAKKLTLNPSCAKDMDIEVIKRSILECIDAITALNHYVAVMCKEYNISWMKMWTQHRLKLIQRKFIKN